MAKGLIMKKDIKNVIVTFGLIATALISGSFLYRKKAESDYALAVKQEQLQNLISEHQAILDQLSQQVVPEAVVLSPSNPTPTALPVRPTPNQKLPVVASKANTTNQQQSQAKVQPTSVVVAPISTPTRIATPTVAAPKPTLVSTPTRKSRAS